MKTKIGKTRRIVALLLLSTLSFLFCGCIAAIDVVRNNELKFKKKNYDTVYVMRPLKDPRDVAPQLIDEFKRLGFKAEYPGETKKPDRGGWGTGFLVSDEGHILTCAHVLGDAPDAAIRISDIRYEADVLLRDKALDVAVLKVRGKLQGNPKPMSVRTSGTYKLGESVFAMGFPMPGTLGFSIKLTNGIINSTKGGKDNPQHIQVSAPIHPGNSGGPVFDGNGVVVGIAAETLNALYVMKETGGAAPQNVNYAIKADAALAFVKSKDEEVYRKIRKDQNLGMDEIERSVVSIDSDLASEHVVPKSALKVTFAYSSYWDGGFRFKHFRLDFYDADTGAFLFLTKRREYEPLNFEDPIIKGCVEQARVVLNEWHLTEKKERVLNKYFAIY